MIQDQRLELMEIESNREPKDFRQELTNLSSSDLTALNLQALAEIEKRYLDPTLSDHRDEYLFTLLEMRSKIFVLFAQIMKKSLRSND